MVHLSNFKSKRRESVRACGYGVSMVSVWTCPTVQFQTDDMSQLFLLYTQGCERCMLWEISIAKYLHIGCTCCCFSCSFIWLSSRTELRLVCNCWDSLVIWAWVEFWGQPYFIFDESSRCRPGVFKSLFVRSDRWCWPDIWVVWLSKHLDQELQLQLTALSTGPYVFRSVVPFAWWLVLFVVHLFTVLFYGLSVR